MGFILFLLLNATLFIRPAEIVPSMMDLPIYEFLILGCLAFTLPSVLRQLSPRSLAERPASACVVGVLASVVLSHLSHLSIAEAFQSGVQFSKVLLYFLLLAGLLNSVGRLRLFLAWLLGLIIVLTTLALLQYHSYVDIPAMAAYAERQNDEIDEESGGAAVLVRLCGSGIYGNPNDLSRILAVGLMLGLYFLGDRRSGPIRFLWAAPIALLGFALNLTHSRGGLLALLTGLAALLAERYGGKKTLLVGVVVLPLMFALSAGRQTKISASEGTGQQRIGLWEEGFVLFMRNPIFGIGMDKYIEEVGLAAHNSFVHCFTELGFVGGTFFLGTYYLPVSSLRRLGRPDPEAPYAEADADLELQRMRPLLTAITVGTITGMLTSSRSYSIPTYMIVGLNVAYLRLAATRSASQSERFDARLVKRLTLVSLIVLSVLYIYVRLMVRHGSGFGH